MALPSRFPTRVENWLQSSITHRIAFSALALTALFVALVGSLSYGAMRYLLEQNIHEALDADARIAAQRIELRINDLNRDLADLAANPLIYTALRDPHGRETYLIPFLQGYHLPEIAPLLLCLATPDGRPLACNHPGPHSHEIWAQSPWLGQVQSAQRPLATILRQSGEKDRLQLVFPITLAGTGELAGIMVAELPAEQLVSGTRPLLAPDHFLHLVDGDGKHLFLTPTAAGDGARLTARKALDLYAPFDQLGLAVEVGVPDGRAFLPLRWLTTAYLALALLLLPLVWVLSQAISRRLTRPLAQLAATADHVAESGSLDIRPEVQGRDEVAQLAGSFAQMLDRLKDSLGLLEQRVDERTRQLRDNQEQLRTLINGTPDVIYFNDGTGRWLEMNLAGQRIFGLENSEWRGQDAVAMLGAASLAARDALLECLKSDEATWEGQTLRRREESLPHPEGGEKIFDVIKIPLFHPDGSRRGLIVLGRDITLLKEKEEQLRQLNNELELRIAHAVASNREKDHLLIQQSRLAAMGEMIGNIAHQWRQPLNALGLILANIKYAYEAGDLDRTFIDHILEDGGRLVNSMSATIDDFRNFFKPDKHPSPFELRHTTQEALHMVRPAFANHNIAIALEDGDKIPVTGYPNEYAQVLLNILNNAKDALLERHISPGQVTLRLGLDGDLAWVSVADNGGGVPQEIEDRIFDPYFTTKNKGTDIGLYMSKTIVENSMGGRLCFHNTQEGAEFTIAMPTEHMPAPPRS